MALLSFPQLPLELIIHISNFIDNSTLVIFLRICRAWHNLLRPLCYRTISRTQWHHPHFPLRDLAHLSDAALAPLLGQIHSFEWFSNEALTTGGVIDTRRRKKQLEGESQFILRSQVPLQQLTRMLAMMASTLVHLRIEDWWWGYTKSQVSAILPFKRLTSLSLTFPSHYELVPLLELKSWISLLSRLEKLEIGGLPQMFVVNDATRSEIRSVSTHPWPMKTLKVPTCQISWIEFCPRLQELEIDHTFSHYHSLSGSITPATTPLDTWCPELEILRLAGWFGKEHSYQQGLVIASLKRLKSLTLIKRLYEDNFDFLMPGNQLGDEKIENLPCPMLEHLEVCRRPEFYYHSNHVDITPAVCWFLLRTRPKLKSLVVPFARCDPRVIFTLAPSGYGTGGGGGGSDTGVVCMGLEHLAIGLFPRLFRERQQSGRISGSSTFLWKEEQQGYSRTVFQYLCRFRSLRRLSLIGVGIDRGIALEEMKKAGGWPCLERLIMSNNQHPLWGKEELGQWMELLPCLKWIRLKPATSEHLEEMARWMIELGYAHVKVSLESWETIAY